MKFKTFITESKKQSKNEVDYRQGTTSKHCGICTMFRSPHTCTAVQGPIEKDDVCDIFERKS